MAFALLAAAISGSMDGALAYSVKYIMNDVFIAKDKEMLKLMPFILIGIYLAKCFFLFSQTYIMRYVGQRVIEKLRNAMFRKMIYLPLRFFSDNSTGTLMARITNDINIVQAAIPTIVNMVRYVITVLGLLVVIFTMNWQLALITMICYPFLIYPLFLISRKIRKYSKRGQESMGGLTSALQESFSGVRVVKAFVNEDKETLKFSKVNAQSVGFELKIILASESVVPIIEFIGAIGIASILYIGGYWVVDGKMDAGSFFAFVAALSLVYKPIKDLGNANNSLQSALAASERVFSMLETKNEILDNDGTKDCDASGKEIEFRNVSFRYPDDDKAILDNISFKARPGATIAFVGPSGAGKSTMANLIPRFYDVIGGEILIGGENIKNYKVHSLRKNIGMVSQEPFLFDESIRNNIAYAKDDFTTEDVEKAAKAAYADEFIAHLPHKYDTMTGERGVKLSGGQKQRITIARALLKNPPILILDEATSALDTESERVVQKALDNLMQGRTSFVIAHRLSTILKSDMIIVLLDGKIEATGRHEELLKTSHTYKKLYEMQFMGGAEKKEKEENNIIDGDKA